MRILIQFIFCLIFATPALSFHGYSFELRVGEGSVVVYFEPDAGSSDDWGALSKPTILLSDFSDIVVESRRANVGIIDKFQVFLSFDEESWSYVLERLDGNTTIAVREEDDLGSPETFLAEQVLCKEPISLRCPTETVTDPAIVVDTRELNAEGAFGDLSALDPLVLFKQLGTPDNGAVFVLPLNDGANGFAESNGIGAGSLDEVFENTANLFELSLSGFRLKQNQKHNQNAAGIIYKRFDRSGYPKSSALDPKLNFIILHCTAIQLSENSVNKLIGKKRGKGHVYIMPDGKVIDIWPITTNPNHVLATKTELSKCPTTRPMALRTMYHIELNYACNYRPQKSPDPSSAQMDSLAKLIANIFTNYGPFHISAHTYVDMGINSSRAHTDPQGRGGFKYQHLYDSIQAFGVDLSNVVKVEESFAQKYPISQQRIKHHFPPIMNRELPLESQTAIDSCQWRGK